MQKYFHTWYVFCPRCKTSLEYDDHSTRCSSCGFVAYLNASPGVGAIIEKDHAILLVKRKFDPHKNTWDIPGGFLNSDESFESALHRELFEELGVEINIVRYLGSEADEYNGRPIINTIFLCTIVSGTPVPTDDIAEIQWFDRENMPYNDIAFAYVKKIVQSYINTS
ncbi:MAG: NUDIX hydrolase [Candidatus Pacebacteria bacterium]|nr:NUDIX hydrolase [Candidatus Paceibacterota bacterium]